MVKEITEKEWRMYGGVALPTGNVGIYDESQNALLQQPLMVTPVLMKNCMIFSATAMIMQSASIPKGSLIIF